MFWIALIIGAAIAVGCLYLLVKSSYQLKWWHWLLAVLVILALFAAFQHLFSSFTENEVKSAWIGFAIFGVLAVIIGVVNWQFIIRSKK